MMTKSPKRSTRPPSLSPWLLIALFLFITVRSLSLIGEETFAQLEQWPILHQERDFPSYYLAGRRILQGEDFYGGLQAEGREVGFENYFIDTAVTPPTFNLVVTPLALLSYLAAWGVWQALSLLSLIAILPLIVHELRLTFSLPGWITLLCGVLIFPPLGFHIIYTHSELFMLLLLAGGWILLRRGRQVPAGLLLGLAGALRLYPLFLLLYLAQRRDWKAFWAAVGSGLGLAALAALVTGPNSYIRYLSVLRDTVPILYTLHGNLSLWGSVHKLAVIWPTLGQNPALRDILAMLASLSILGLTLWLTRKPGPTPYALDREYGLAVVAMLLASPLSWIHYQVLLYLPLLVLLRKLRERHHTPLFVAAILALIFSVTPLFGGQPDIARTPQRILSFLPTLTLVCVYVALVLADTNEHE